MWWLKPGTTEYSNPPISFDKITNEKLEPEKKKKLKRTHNSQNRTKSQVFARMYMLRQNLEGYFSVKSKRIHALIVAASQVVESIICGQTKQIYLNIFILNLCVCVFVFSNKTNIYSEFVFSHLLDLKSHDGRMI